MENLEMVDALKRFRAHREEYIQTWNEQVELIKKKAIVTDDKVACEMRHRSVADVAKARPQYETDEDDP